MLVEESTYLYEFADAKHDPKPFGDKFQQCMKEAGQVLRPRHKHQDEESPVEVPDGCVFPSLSKGSILVAPMMKTDESTTNVYGHLASFVRRAPTDQIISFWKLVMKTYIDRMYSEDPEIIWLSTDGTGVAWLHVRLDESPKYYDYPPYRVPIP